MSRLSVRTITLTTVLSLFTLVFAPAGKAATGPTLPPAPWCGLTGQTSPAPQPKAATGPTLPPAPWCGLTGPTLPPAPWDGVN
jgi:hypothetical protein